MAKNIVIAGLHKGCSIASGVVSSSASGKFLDTVFLDVVYIIIKGSHEKYLNNLTVRSINVVDKNTMNSWGTALAGTLVFGSGGAVLGSNQSSIIIEVIWKNGEKSLISINGKVHEKLIVAMYETTTPEEQVTMELIKCPVCKNDLSTKVDRCPHCGYISSQKYIADPAEMGGCGMACVVFLFVIMMIMFVSCGAS